MRSDHAALAQITTEQWARLAERSIYFGHQSVGRNILDGIGDITAANSQIRLPGLKEFSIGRNCDPDSKNAAFIAATNHDLGPHPILMFKYCYVDTNADSDVRLLFERYRQTVNTLRARHAGATIVHFTLPLVAESSRLRYWMNTVRGIPTTRTENAKRNEYNELLRRECAGEPIYDIAAIESMKPDGTPEFAMLNGKAVYALAAEWTSDGGHLNAAGRRRAAEQLLVLLARVASRPL